MRVPVAIQNPHKLVSLVSRHAFAPLACRERTSDFLSFHQVFIQREYACLDDLPPPRLVLDCGAYVGYSAAYFLSRFPGCRVVAVEPDAGNFALLRMNLAPYGERARALRAAVWSHPAGLKASEAPYRDGREWSRQVRECRPGEAADFPGVDVGGLLRESGFSSISLLKVDIEGAEKVVFGPGSEDWLARAEAVVGEVHDAEDERVFSQAVAAQPFRVSRHGELTVCRRPLTR